jgi:hypothetical protein
MKSPYKNFKDNTKVVVKSDNIYIYKHRSTEQTSSESSQTEDNNNGNSGFYNIIC